MDGIQATRETLGLVHEYLDAAIGDCEPETLKKTFPGATIGSVLSIYFHALSAEDVAIQQLIRGKPTVLDQGAWYERWGLPAPSTGAEVDWSQVDVPLSRIQEYAKEVYAATDEWLAASSDAALDAPIPWHSGQTHTAGWVIADMIHVHLPFHAGEIAALKGLMGLKGLPW